MEDYKKFLLAGAAVLGATVAMFPSTDADAAGYYGSGWPSPTTATGTLPLTGNETSVFDTNLPNGQNPQSEVISTGTLSNYIGGSQFGGGMKNTLIGGDFATNLWQRGTSILAITSTSPTYTADRWFVAPTTAGSIGVTRQTTNQITRQGASLRFQRTSGDTNVTQITLAQVLTTANSWRFAGRTAVLSFNAKAGANFLTAPGAFNAAISTGTGTDQSATNLLAAAWTGQVNNVASIAPTTSFVRYSLAVPIPAAATQLGVQFYYTPVTATAGSTEYLEFGDIQLEVSGQSASWASAANYSIGETVVSNGNLYSEVATSCTSGAGTAPTGTTNGEVDNTCTWNYVQGGAVPVQPTAFDKRLAQAESTLQYQYYQRTNEGTAGAPVAPCMAVSTTALKCEVDISVPMRANPSASSVSNGTFGAYNSAGTANAACTIGTSVALATADAALLNVTCGTAAFGQGFSSLLVGGSGTGWFDFSSEL